MPQVKETPSAFVQHFLEVEANANGITANFALRRRALDIFDELGLPTPRQEEWKYTDVRALQDWTPKYAIVAAATDPALDSALDGILESGSENGQAPALRLVFIDGVFSSQYSRMDESTVAGPLSQIAAQSDNALTSQFGTAGPTEDFVFAALNTALHQDGGAVHVPASQVLDRPIHLIHVSSGRGTINTSHPRNLIVLGDNAQARVLEDYISLGEGASFTNPVTEIMLGNNAHLDHYRFARENESVLHIATTFAQLGRDAQLTTNNMSRGGKLIRNDLRVYLGGEGAGCTLNGLNVASGAQLMDDHTVVIHAVPHCFSREFYRSVLDDESRGVFNGKVFVCQDAQKTDGVQENKGLILSSKALMNTKPQLEIFADDVKCTHGATIGQLDQDALFYLQSRGIDRNEARKILVHAFAHDIIERMTYGPAKVLAADLLGSAVTLS